MGATVRLPRIVGDSRARELILLGAVIGADEARHIGLADRVVEDRDVSSAARDVARQLATRPPLALRGARRAIEAAWTHDPHEALAVAVEEQLRCLTSDDFTEALQAMTERRQPQWKGQ
jgi:enoyl-CoA hydratase/carnithine racemase